MSVIVVGLEQKRAPLEILDRVTVTETDIPKALGRLRDQRGEGRRSRPQSGRAELIRPANVERAQRRQTGRGMAG